MKPNDKAIEADAVREVKSILNTISPITDNETIAQNIVGKIIAAYAAQFQSEDYAGLVKELRDWDFCWPSYSIEQAVPKAADALETLLAKLNSKPKPSEDYAELIETLRSSSPYTLSHVAADAIEAVLAERDDFAEQIALRSENGISKDLQEFLRKFKEDDSAAIRMFAQYRDLEIEMDSWKSLWEKTNAHMRQVEAERDALLARLTSVDDEALVEIAADAIDVPLPSLTWEEREAVARAAIAAIRPHIEAAERERCAKEIDEYRRRYGDEYKRRYGGNWTALFALAAAIRSGK